MSAVDILERDGRKYYSIARVCALTGFTPGYVQERTRPSTRVKPQLPALKVGKRLWIEARIVDTLAVKIIPQIEPQAPLNDDEFDALGI